MRHQHCVSCCCAAVTHAGSSRSMRRLQRLALSLVERERTDVTGVRRDKPKHERERERESITSIFRKTRGCRYFRSPRLSLSATQRKNYRQRRRSFIGFNRRAFACPLFLLILGTVRKSMRFIILHFHISRVIYIVILLSNGVWLDITFAINTFIVCARACAGK